MQAIHVRVIPGPGSGQRAKALVKVLLDAWPATDVPSFDVVHSDAAEPADPRRCALALLLISSYDEVRAHLDLLDQAEELRWPLVVLCDQPDKVADFTQSGSVFVFGLETPPAQLALRMDTLIRRQAAVARFADELRLASRCHTGLQGEITRIHDELRLAAMIQREHLPKTLPEIDDVRFGVFYRPAGYVSGDMYDIRKLNDHCVGFFLADAVGHGVPAALLTVVISRCLQLTIPNGNQSRVIQPAQVLTGLNEEMLRYQSTGGRFATALYGIIDTRTNVVTIAGAGHPAPLLIDHDAQVTPVATSGGLLGVFPDAGFDQASVTLKPGQRLVCYTDGFETAYPSDRIDGPDDRPLPTNRCLDVFGALCARHAASQDVVQTLTRSIDDQRGSLHQDDDLTAIIIQADATAAQRSHALLAARSHAA